MAYETDTIAAIATPPGRGGIGIVRLSGPKALTIGEQIAGCVLKPGRTHKVVFRDARGAAVDDGIVLAFRAPASFTGEHVVELQGHGGTVVLIQMLAVCTDLGARLARPGEFSERAFLNERLDLVQAEAIADLVDAATTAAASAALRSLQGEFSRCIRALMDAVTRLRVSVEAALDFPDEEVDLLTNTDLKGALEALRAQLAQVRVEARRGALLAGGMTLVLAGAPNAGKSSLLNALARRDVAIVTAVPGTTRDPLREQIDLDGLPVQVVDTAGLRETSDIIEVEGVRRAQAEIGRADVLLYLYDASLPVAVPHDLTELCEQLGGPFSGQVLVGRNKIDLLADGCAGLDETGAFPVLALSVRTGEGLELLTQQIKRFAGFDAGSETTFTARARHLTALDEAHSSLDAAWETAVAGSEDLLAEHLSLAHQALGRIVGAMTSDDLLGEIFSSFCIGK